MKVVCYYRHSTDNEMQEANSIPRQRRSCHGFASRLGWTVVKEVEDAGTSGAGDKKNLIQLAEDVKDGLIKFDTLLVDNQTRLTRKDVFRILEDVEWLQKSNIRISCVADNDVEPQSVNQWAADPARIMKGWSNNQKIIEAAEESVSGMLTAHEEKRMSWVGKAPFGFDIKLGDWPEHTKKRKDKPYRTLVANDDIEIVKDIYQKFLDGRSISSLTEELGKSNAHKGKFPNPTSVKHILRNPVYAGTWAFGVRNVGGTRVMNDSKPRNNWHVNMLDYAASIWKGYVPSFVSMELFLAVQEKLDNKSKTKRGRPVSNTKPIYSGVFRCGCCESALTPAPRKSYRKEDANKGIYVVDYRCFASQRPYGRCRGGVKPFSKTIPEVTLSKMVDDFFANAVSLNASFHWNLIEALAEEMKETSFTAKAGLNERLAEIVVEEKSLAQVFEKLIDLPSWAIEKQNQLSKERLEIREKLESAAPYSSYVATKVDEFKKGLDDEGGRYLSLIYDVLQRYAAAKYGWSDERKLQETQEFLERLFTEMSNGPMEMKVYANDADEIGGFSFDNPKTVLQVLKAMGLEGGKIHFRKTTPEEGRGERWIPDGIELEFGWLEVIGDKPHTLRVKHVFTDGISTIHLA